jgi:KipI family sensor histidine kinase inhibitor
VELHAAATYQVYFLGFAPGFAYLGGLPAALHTPRLCTPRPLVPAGSVGIAGRQTGVYPLATPGGWRLIGRTSLVLFAPQRTPMSLLQPGDEVRFVPDSVAAGGQGSVPWR